MYTRSPGRDFLKVLRVCASLPQTVCTRVLNIADISLAPSSVFAAQLSSARLSSRASLCQGVQSIGQNLMLVQAEFVWLVFEKKNLGIYAFELKIPFIVTSILAKGSLYGEVLCMNGGGRGAGSGRSLYPRVN